MEKNRVKHRRQYFKKEELRRFWNRAIVSGYLKANDSEYVMSFEDEYKKLIRTWKGK